MGIKIKLSSIPIHSNSKIITNNTSHIKEQKIMSYRTINTTNVPTNTNNSNPTNNNANNSNQNNQNTSSNNGSGSIPVLNIGQAISQSQIPDLLINYENLAKNKKISKVMFREDITNRLLTTLTTKKHPNALLVGDAGTGKTAIVEDLAVRLYEHDAITSAMLGDETKIYELPLTNLVAGSSLVGTLEAKLKDVVDFISDEKNHAILYVDEIHQLTTNQELKTVAEILKPALARGDMHVIGSTTTQELKFWQQNPALTRRFSNIIVNELTDAQTINILKMVLPQLQTKGNIVRIDTSLLPEIVRTGNQYAKTLNTHRPDSAITILDQALSMSRLKALTVNSNPVTANTNLTPTVTNNIIHQAGRQLVNNNNKDIDSDTITDLKNRFDQYIVGQSVAKEKVLSAMKSIMLDLVPQTKPHSFLFAGLTGTGKTEMAKQLATSLFGSPDRFIYLNMTEYAHDESLNRLIGSPRGYVGSTSAQPLPLDSLKSNPFQIVLLDEFEKAGKDIQRIFMQALDEGAIQYNDGSAVDFSQAIIIATTNAGTEQFNENHVGFNPEQEISEHDLANALSNNFPPELLNRFEYLVSFNAINQSEYADVLAIKYNNLIKEIENTHNKYELYPKTVTKDTGFIKELANQSYDSLKNARPAERTIKHFVEHQIEQDPAQKIFHFDENDND